MTAGIYDNDLYTFLEYQLHSYDTEEDVTTLFSSSRSLKTTSLPYSPIQILIHTATKLYVSTSLRKYGAMPYIQKILKKLMILLSTPEILSFFSTPSSSSSSSSSTSYLRNRSEPGRPQGWEEEASRYGEDETNQNLLLYLYNLGKTVSQSGFHLEFEGWFRVMFESMLERLGLDGKDPASQREIERRLEGFWYLRR